MQIQNTKLYGEIERDRRRQRETKVLSTIEELKEKHGTLLLCSSVSGVNQLWVAFTSVPKSHPPHKCLSELVRVPHLRRKSNSVGVSEAIAQAALFPVPFDPVCICLCLLPLVPALQEKLSMF